MCQVLAKHPDTNPDPKPKPNQVLAKHPPVFKACLRDVADRLDDHEAYVRLFAAQLLEPISANELRPHTADFKKRRSLLKTGAPYASANWLSRGLFERQIDRDPAAPSFGHSRPASAHKAAQTSADWLSGGPLERQIVLQTALSLPSPSSAHQPLGPRRPATPAPFLRVQTALRLRRQRAQDRAGHPGPAGRALSRCCCG